MTKQPWQIWLPVIGLYWANPRKVNKKVYEPYQLLMCAISYYIIWFT